MSLLILSAGELTVPVIQVLYALHSHHHGPDETDQRRRQENRSVRMKYRFS